jgi:AAA domain-containing protein
MTLGAVRSSRRAAPDRILLVGTEGVGKSTFAADAPKPIFIAPEDGVHHLDVDVFPEPRTWGDVIEAVQVLQRDPHEYQTVVLDTVDWLEPLNHAEVCRRNNWDDIEAPGYGKGYVPATAEWRKLLMELDRLRAARGMEIILLAHATMKNVPNPNGPDYARYECKLQKSAAALLKEWTDVNLFAAHEEYVLKAKGENRAKATVTGKRVIHTVRSAGWDAKNRYGLPEELPLSYDAYAEARAGGQPADAGQLYAEAQELLAQVPEAAREKLAARIEAIKDDALRLSRAVNELRSRVAAATQGPAEKESA